MSLAYMRSCSSAVKVLGVTLACSCAGQPSWIAVGAEGTSNGMKCLVGHSSGQRTTAVAMSVAIENGVREILARANRPIPEQLEVTTSDETITFGAKGSAERFTARLTARHETASDHLEYGGTTYEARDAYVRICSGDELARGQPASPRPATGATAKDSSTAAPTKEVDPTRDAITSITGALDRAEIGEAAKQLNELRSSLPASGASEEVRGEISALNGRLDEGFVASWTAPPVLRSGGSSKAKLLARIAFEDKAAIAGAVTCKSNVGACTATAETGEVTIDLEPQKDLPAKAMITLSFSGLLRDLPIATVPRVGPLLCTNSTAEPFLGRITALLEEAGVPLVSSSACAAADAKELTRFHIQINATEPRCKKKPRRFVCKSKMNTLITDNGRGKNKRLKAKARAFGAKKRKAKAKVLAKVSKKMGKEIRKIMGRRLDL